MKREEALKTQSLEAVINLWYNYIPIEPEIIECNEEAITLEDGRVYSIDYIHNLLQKLEAYKEYLHNNYGKEYVIEKIVLKENSFKLLII